MAKKNVIGSVAGLEQAAKEPDAPETIHSEPENAETPERDSGPENDPSTTGPVEEDGNLDPVDTTDELDGSPDLDDDLGVLDGSDADIVDDAFEAPLTQEEIDEAARALAAGEDTEDEEDKPKEDKPEEKPPEEPATAPVGLKPAVNEDGYRNHFVNKAGDITVLDDETAETFFANPKFYSHVYDSGTRRSIDVNFAFWCDEKGVRTGGTLGEPYSKDD